MPRVMEGMYHYQLYREITVKLSGPLYRSRSICRNEGRPSRTINRYRNQRFPHKITAHAVWPYHRFETIHATARLILEVKLWPGSGQASADYPNYRQLPAVAFAQRSGTMLLRGHDQPGVLLVGYSLTFTSNFKTRIGGRCL